MKHLKEKGVITELHVCFSRDEQPADAARYVQDNIVHHGKTLVELIDTAGAYVFVCGDAKNMAKDVNQAFMSILQDHKGMLTKICNVL